MQKPSRITVAEELNAALSEPSVIAALAPGYDDLDTSAFIKDGKHIALRCGDAVAIFIFVRPGVYEGHYAFPSSVRGKEAFDAARVILYDMFTKYDADTIVGHTPRDFRAARNLSYRLGFRKTHNSVDSFGRECVSVELRREK